MRTILLDNEAVQALADHQHAKHRTVVAHLAGVVARRRRGVDVRAVVTTTVRVEAGWGRSHPRSAGINRMRIADVALGSAQADIAAEVVRRTGVSVADAHIGAIARGLEGQVVVLTSDPDDMVRVRHSDDDHRNPDLRARTSAHPSRSRPERRYLPLS